jgi:hypothetical protein
VAAGGVEELAGAVGGTVRIVEFPHASARVRDIVEQNSDSLRRGGGRLFPHMESLLVIRQRFGEAALLITQHAQIHPGRRGGFQLDPGDMKLGRFSIAFFGLRRIAFPQRIS